MDREKRMGVGMSKGLNVINTHGKIYQSTNKNEKSHKVEYIRKGEQICKEVMVKHYQVIKSVVQKL